MNREIILLAHNIRSLWNVGSFFRTADCFGVRRIILSGYTPLPPRREISKTALGAEEWIPWEHIHNPLDAIKKAKKEGYAVIALERIKGAKDIGSYTPPSKILLIVGHEILGVPKELLSAADDLLQIPMHGKKESLNVAVAAGIALERLANA
jgi:tRNA G18 (ribose-2'-O)-methylase SpoU